jgi:hypothetical protein
MPLPKQVQAQADAVEQYEKQVAEARQAAEPKPPEDPPPADPPDNGTEPTPVDPPKPPVEDDAAQWRQRYLSLQGQYNSQVPDLQRQVQNLMETVNGLREELKTKEAPAHPPSEPSELVTNKDVEAFGEDLVDLARRIAKDEFGKRESKYLKQIDALQEQLAEAKGSVGQIAEVQAKTASARFFEALQSAVPTWNTVQQTAECQSFLGSRIPGTGATWDMALKEAAANRDAETAIEVFEEFFKRFPQHDPKAKPAAQNSAKQELQRQVAPGKSAAAATTPQNKRVYSGQDFHTESMRIMRLTQQGKHDEAARLDAELNAALAEGRVTP